MDRLLGLLIFIIIFLLSINVSAFATTVEVTAEGAGLSRSLALNDAFKNALEQFSGIVISSNTIVMDNTIIADKTAAYSSGYIKDYVTVSERVEAPHIYITIKAIVSSDINSKVISYSDNSTDNISKTKNIEKGNTSNLKALKSLLSLELPKKIDNIEQCISMSVSSIETVKALSANVTSSIDSNCILNAVNTLYIFLSNTGFDVQITDNRLGIIVYSDGSDAYNTLLRTFNEYKKDSKDKNYRLILYDSMDRILDSYKIADYQHFIFINNNNINVILDNILPIETKFYANVGSSVLKRAVKISSEISKINDIGYRIGVTVAVPSQKDNGLRVLQVLDNLPAKEIGIIAGDVIVSINEQKIKSVNEALDIINNNGSKSIIIEIDRRGEVLLFEILSVKRKSISDRTL